MNLDIRSLNVPVSEALAEFARERVARSLRPFLASVERVDVRFQDLNGPRGGVDKLCTVTVALTGFKRSVVVKSTSADAYDAVQHACVRVAQSVARALTRRRQLERWPAPGDFVRHAGGEGSARVE